MQPVSFEVERMGESGGHCDCCGHDSRRVWGMVHTENGTAAAYWMSWTEGHLSDIGANLDLVIGQWGEDASAQDRVAVSLVHRECDTGPKLMVIDATSRDVADSSLVHAALRREDVIGTPLAPQIFALTDAIYEQDGRFF